MWQRIRKKWRKHNYIITSCIKRKRIATNSTNPLFIIATFWTCFFSPFSSFNDEKLSYKDFNKRITTRDNGKVQHRYNKIWICQISCDSFSFNKKHYYYLLLLELILLNCVVWCSVWFFFVSLNIM